MSRQTTSEARLQRQVLDLLKHREGWWGYKVVASPLQPKGIPDIAGSYLGASCWIELKAPEKYDDPRKGLSKLQEATIEAIERTGAFVCVTDSVEGVEQFLDMVRDCYVP